jgi:tRNA A-37 threonylcarbamoyl transferase component Bud32
MAKQGQRGGSVEGDVTIPLIVSRMRTPEPIVSDRQRTLIDKKQAPAPPFAAHQPSAARPAALAPPHPPAVPPPPPAAHGYRPPVKPPRQVEAPTESDLVSHDFGKRYRLGKPLGQGAMGEVLVTRDLRVLRDVAMKRMHVAHHAHADLRRRFLREARVQGQLEHPALVPVYDIGVDPEGREYFTMKRVRGRTLEDIVRGLRSGDPAFQGQYSRRKLLTAVSRISLAVAFAHERGVVHRDLKPANIMLGDYGEVHLLDWGIAKISGVDDPNTQHHIDLNEQRPQRTQQGFVVGTPGYMAPEQARGETRTYGGRSDIYSLGAILFEAMTLEPLHNETKVENILLSTVTGIEVRPSVRAPHLDLPSELDDIIVKATALNPEQRYATARELNDDIEKLLDGDRDSARRAEIAAKHTANAKAALVLARRGGPMADGQHRKAVGELLQALALEPNNADARSTMVQLLIEPVERLPLSAYAELQEVDRRDRARASRANGWAFLAWIGIFPLVLAMGVRDFRTLLWLGGIAFAVTAYTWWMASSGRTETPFMVAAGIAAFAIVGATSAFFGPLFFVPGLAVTAAASLLVAIRANRRARSLVLLGSLASVLVPTIMHLTGVIAPRYAFDGHGLTIVPGVVELPERATWAFLLVANCLTVLVANLLVGRAVAALLRAERRLFTQAWRLRQFLPDLPQQRRTAPAAPRA